MTDDELTTAIALLQKKIKRLENAGPGAGMATAMNSVRLRELQGELAKRQESISAPTRVPSGKLTTRVEVQLLLDAYDQSEGAKTFGLAANERLGAYHLYKDLPTISGSWGGSRESFDRLADWVIATKRSK